ncbi:DJ-1/PfpI family protein [Candidatus Peregrinibacteria bacterium]|jgi:protease I|nr:DJ-1/PfpI family protein [Candidatus Peregrinibacteria bacterium]MBT7484500.1 DJ-1/PfpI family protein [Candidatus Peregrinibacteria bacterium]MBT7703407.1 DJ-1/PfpI family protein [Candidatus Peregrinibacteria bacterium]
MANVLLIISPQDYQDKEYSDTKAALEAADHIVFTASTVEKAHGKLGGIVECDALMYEANAEDYDAVVFIGGTGCFEYFEDDAAHSVAKDFYEAGKLTCAICAAPGILANCGLLDGKEATCWPGEENHIQEKGAKYTATPVQRDGLIITGNGPEAAHEFGQTIADAL